MKSISFKDLNADLNHEVQNKSTHRSSIPPMPARQFHQLRCVDTEGEEDFFTEKACSIPTSEVDLDKIYRPVENVNEFLSQPPRDSNYCTEKTTYVHDPRIGYE